MKQTIIAAAAAYVVYLAFGGTEANRPKELWFDYVRKGFALTFR